MTGAEGNGASAADADERALISRHIDASLVDGVRTLFDDVYYRTASGFASASRYEALEHYLEIGWHERFDPHPLFDTRYYLETHEQLAASDDNPLLHYLSEGAAAGADPSPYFDTDYYYSQLDPTTRIWRLRRGTPSTHSPTTSSMGRWGKRATRTHCSTTATTWAFTTTSAAAARTLSRTSCSAAVWRDGRRLRRTPN